MIDIFALNQESAKYYRGPEIAREPVCVQAQDAYVKGAIARDVKCDVEDAFSLHWEAIQDQTMQMVRAYIHDFFIAGYHRYK